MIKKHYATLAAFVFSGLYFLAVFVFGIDLFELVITGLATLESYEIDEFLIPFVGILFAFQMDALRVRKIETIELEKTKIYKAMLSSVYHVMNNFLNQMQLFKITAETTPGFDPDVLSLYDSVINDASAQIKALGSVARIDAQLIRDAVKPKSHASSITRNNLRVVSSA